jgi:hypothetical protein
MSIGNPHFLLWVQPRCGADSYLHYPRHLDRPAFTRFRKVDRDRLYTQYRGDQGLSRPAVRPLRP